MGGKALAFTEDHKVVIGSMLTIQNLDSIDEGLHAIILRELDKIQFSPTNCNSRRSVAAKPAIPAITGIILFSGLGGILCVSWCGADILCGKEERSSQQMVNIYVLTAFKIKSVVQI